MGLTVRSWEFRKEIAGGDVATELTLAMPAAGKFQQLHALYVSVKPWQQVDWDIKDGAGVLLYPGSGPVAISGLDVMASIGRSMWLTIAPAPGAMLRVYAEGTTVTVP